MALTAILVAGCTGTETETVAVSPEDSCVHAHDGVCDEPRNCALGSDSTDCDQACAPAYSPAIAAACAYDEPLVEPPLEDPGSHGSGGPGGTWDGIIQARGPAGPDVWVDRYYRVYVPPTYDPAKPTPLLYVMGGFRVHHWSLAGDTEFNRLADLNNFIVVYLKAHWVEYGVYGWLFNWFTYRQDYNPQQWPACPDLDYVQKLSDELKGLYNIDRTRIFASGHSRGGAMAALFAFELPNLFAGMLPTSGFFTPNGYLDRIAELNPARKVSAVIIHGDIDPDVPVSESDGLYDALNATGHLDWEHIIYLRLPGVTHAWQPQVHQQAWTFLSERPLPLEMAAP
ncbi:MAG: hypothetical protein JRI68_18890 [Deltaproteobacteria bacterium]|nr:hypothetical protein [Deltaproteobacteria bacterium]